MTTKNEYVSKLIGQAFVVVLTIVISMTGFWMMLGRELVTRDEVHTIVNTRVIAIDYKLEQRSESDARLERVIEKNTDAIVSLQVQIATLNAMLRIMEIQREDN